MGKVLCKNVVIATGLWVPKKDLANIVAGSEHMIGYDDLPRWNADGRPNDAWKEMFTNKDVAIMGTGNAAMEVAQAMLPMVGAVHMMGHSSLKFSDDTHYPGSIRAH